MKQSDFAATRYGEADEIEVWAGKAGNLKRGQHDGIGCGVDEPSSQAKFPNPANANVFFVQVKTTTSSRLTGHTEKVFMSKLSTVADQNSGH